MSKIDKLNIMGVRSFPHGHGETITFYTPLTLIVGINGSGKTTVVECLKYATTGFQPPNTKGGAFIHDPKLSGEKEVMAQVKMQFRNTKGARMVVTRSLQLTVKKTTRTMKTLEGSLLIDNHGERTTLSTRVAELDRVMPQYLGVAPAVLDNVIFCHQDESLWPLSEPSALKKKFDEIFEAQKYIKAIDNIKLIRKKHNEDLGKFKIMEQHAKEDKDRAAKARERSEKLSKEIEDLRVRCEELRHKSEEAAARADGLWRSSEDFSRTLGVLEGKKIEAKGKQGIINNLREHLKEVTESDEWLEQTLDQFNFKMTQYEEERNDKKESWLELKDELKGLNEKLQGKLAEKGKHEQDKEEYERQLDRQRNMVREAAAKHQLRGFDDLDDDSIVEDFLYKIRKLSKDQNVALEKARSQADNEKQEALNSINRLTERKAALQDSKVSAKQQISQHDREALQYQSRVDQIRADEGSKAIIESRIADVNARLDSAKTDSQGANWDLKLKEANMQLRAHEDETSRLNNELVQGTKRAGENARLAHLKQELKEKKTGLGTLTSAHGDRISQLIGSDWTPATIESVHRAALEAATRQLVNAERERDYVTREMEQVQFKQKTIRENINRNVVEAEKHKDIVCQVNGGDLEDFDQTLKMAQDQLDDARDQSKGFGGVADYFRNCLETLNGAVPSCRTCNRGFKNATDPAVGLTRRRLQGLIKKAESDTASVELAAAEAYFKELTDASIHMTSWRKLTNEEIPILESESKMLGSQRDTLVTQVESHDKTVAKKQLIHKDLETITRTVASIAKCAADITMYDHQIDELNTKQSQQGSTKTLEDIQEEVGTINEVMQSTKKMISQINSDQNASRTTLHELELELRDLKNELNAGVSELEKKASLLSRVDEFKRLTQKEHDKIDNANGEIEKLQPQISTAQAILDDHVQRWSTQLASLTQGASFLSETVNGLNLSNDQIKSYLDRGGSDRLSIVKREIQTLEQNIRGTEEQQVQLTREISKVEEYLRDSENTKRQYADNLRYRIETRALEQLREEIRELASHNAEVERDDFQAKSKQARRDHQKYEGDRQGLIGQMKSKDVQLGEVMEDFKTDFKDAPKRYQEARIKVETTKAAVADLQVYGNALDNAIMKFHAIKMEQVNDIIGDLWTKTYKGSDVDRIMICSDNEAGASASTTRGRSYNYRVVMVKQGVEMDMRGRCSAGQKVLASIIIRLALADVFSQDCGLIALDEPTTNLDRANIISLAHALHDIIKERQKQANFQLIVITHDEEFLRAMNCGDFTDYYYRVSRDQKADSIIERQDISEVER